MLVLWPAENNPSNKFLLVWHPINPEPKWTLKQYFEIMPGCVQYRVYNKLCQIVCLAVQSNLQNVNVAKFWISYFKANCVDPLRKSGKKIHVFVFMWTTEICLLLDSIERMRKTGVHTWGLMLNDTAGWEWNAVLQAQELPKQMTQC